MLEIVIRNIPLSFKINEIQSTLTLCPLVDQRSESDQPKRTHHLQFLNIEGNADVIYYWIARWIYSGQPEPN
jgi:hypothetical protein